VTDGNRGAFWQNGIWHESVYEAKVLQKCIVNCGDYIEKIAFCSWKFTLSNSIIVLFISVVVSTEIWSITFRATEVFEANSIWWLAVVRVGWKMAEYWLKLFFCHFRCSLEKKKNKDLSKLSEILQKESSIWQLIHSNTNN